MECGGGGGEGEVEQLKARGQSARGGGIRNLEHYQEHVTQEAARSLKSEDSRKISS